MILMITACVVFVSACGKPETPVSPEMEQTGEESTEEVGDGDVTLNQVEAEVLEVYGGGEESIHASHSTFRKVVIHREGARVRFVVEEGTRIESLEATNTIVEVKRGAEIVDMIVKADTTVLLEEEAKVTVSLENCTAKNVQLYTDSGASGEDMLVGYLYGKELNAANCSVENVTIVSAYPN